MPPHACIDDTYHLQGFLIGTIFSLAPGLIVAAIVYIF